MLNRRAVDEGYVCSSACQRHILGDFRVGALAARKEEPRCTSSSWGCVINGAFTSISSLLDKEFSTPRSRVGKPCSKGAVLDPVDS